MNVLSPEAILDRLSDRLKLLIGGARDQPARHRTLRATLDWSHDLLTDAERELFARLSVFAGPFGLDAAEVVCGADLDVLGPLVDRSLVRRDGERFELLAIVREYAAERLEERGDADALRDRHAAFFEELAERAYAGRHRDPGTMADLLALDHDDLRQGPGLAQRERREPLRPAGWRSRMVLARALGLRGGPRACRCRAGGTAR